MLDRATNSLVLIDFGLATRDQQSWYKDVDQVLERLREMLMAVRARQTMGPFEPLPDRLKPFQDMLNRACIVFPTFSDLAHDPTFDLVRKERSRHIRGGMPNRQQSCNAVFEDGAMTGSTLSNGDHSPLPKLISRL